MLLMQVLEIEKFVKKYTEAYIFGNDKDLNVFLNCKLNEEDVEFLLLDIDESLPHGINFSHIYDNGDLKVTFKEMI